MIDFTMNVFSNRYNIFIKNFLRVISENRKSYLFSLLSILLLIMSIIAPHFGCTDDTLSPYVPPKQDSKTYEELNFSDQIELHNYPSFGSNKTNFKLNVELRDSSLKILNIKYDFSFDHEYDLKVLTLDTVNTKFSNFGYNTIIASLTLDDNSTISCSTIVWITKPRIISSDNYVYYEPNIYNSQMISVTHGPYHTAQLIDLNTFDMNCYFCDFTSDRFYEMHYSIPSFDGTKIIFDNGIKYRFCYYDFTKNDEVLTDIPIQTDHYSIGKLTWSLDNKSVYYVAVDNDYKLDGIKSCNLETDEIKLVYNKGSYICVVPNQPDKLAILEYIDNSKSKLLIYNLSSNTIDVEYEDIPFYAPFRMLSDNDRIYFDGELAFYSLKRKKTFYMKFEEIDLSDHTEGEADINMGGNKFVITTWGERRALYIITLPNFF